MDRDQALIAAFAAELKARRGSKLSQEKLAHAAGVNRTYVAKLELAQNQPSLTTLLHLANALGIELTVLIDSTVHRYRKEKHARGET